MFLKCVQHSGGGYRLEVIKSTGTISSLHNAGDYLIDNATTDNFIFISSIGSTNSARYCSVINGVPQQLYVLNGSNEIEPTNTYLIKKTDGYYLHYEGSSGTYNCKTIIYDIKQN